MICYRLGITLPIVVAGDNLNFPVVGGFLQHVGAMWIRRSFGDDALYSTLVQSYIDTVMRLGYNFECFIEGTYIEILGIHVGTDHCKADVRELANCCHQCTAFFLLFSIACDQDDVRIV